MTYILILFVTIGLMSEKDSMTITSISGFTDRSQCESGGKASVEKFSIGTKRAQYICIEQTK